ncbi:hypothetical protein ANRL3_02073 [Anaerolineae bacterium]|nr:hypothetical protein ANRL3_02073 [Anaerolineae bacterium]
MRLVILDYIAPRVLELVYTAWDMKPFAEDMGYHSEPYRWDEERRAHLRAELDAYYARLYALTRDELRYTLRVDTKDTFGGDDFPGETFRVLKDKEMRQYGDATQSDAKAGVEEVGWDDVRLIDEIDNRQELCYPQTLYAFASHKNNWRPAPRDNLPQGQPTRAGNLNPRACRAYNEHGQSPSLTVSVCRAQELRFNILR